MLVFAGQSHLWEEELPEFSVRQAAFTSAENALHLEIRLDLLRCKPTATCDIAAQETPQAQIAQAFRVQNAE